MEEFVQLAHLFIMCVQITMPPSEDAEEVIDDEDHGLGDAGDDDASERSELSEEMNPVVPFRRRTHATTIIDVDPDPKESA